MSFILSPLQSVCHKLKPSQVVQVYFGRPHEYQPNSFCRQYPLSSVPSLLEKIREKCSDPPRHDHQKTYYFQNYELSISPSGKNIVQEIQLDHKSNIPNPYGMDLLVLVQTQKLHSEWDFPVMKNYHQVLHQEKIIFQYSSSIRIHLIYTIPLATQEPSSEICQVMVSFKGTRHIEFIKCMEWLSHLVKDEDDTTEEMSSSLPLQPMLESS